ncbi:hypothetical protein [Desulfofarcimen acetoxidans]|nr:hypothetical protein [Desulfofarcimen acetoxidans]
MPFGLPCWQSEENWELLVFQTFLKADRVIKLERIEVKSDFSKRISCFQGGTSFKRILKLELEKNMRYKQRLEEELASFRNIVESDYRTVEGIITSSVRAISERLNEVFVPMNYTVQLEYRNKEEGSGHRRLVMWFKKTHEQQLRVVTERGGLSGGEHAIVSLMMMYSILSVKEEKKMEGKSGGTYSVIPL